MLVDECVYSSSEEFAVFCKETGFAKVIGSNTGGDGIGINPLYFVLPESGIQYRFSSSAGLNPDGSNNEEYGTTPDILCDSKDALEYCISDIEKQSK